MLSHPLWRSTFVQIAVCACLGALTFFTLYDFAWRPHDTLETAILNALIAACFPVLSASFDWVLSRLFRVPVEWGVLFRLQIALAALFLPLSLLVFELSQFHGSWVYAGRLSLLIFGASLMIWAQFLWSHYRAPKNAVRLGTFLGISAFCGVWLAFWSLDNARPLAFAAQNWTEISTPRTRVFYVESESETPVLPRAKEIETMLGRVEETLRSPRVNGKINVFLFPDEASFAAFNGDETLIGVAGQDGLVMVDGDWNTMRATVAHELSHLVLAREMGTNCRTVLDEGTAVWLENKIASGDDTIAPEKQSNLKTENLASDEGFFPDDEEEIYAHYGHAGWLATTTIKRDGLGKWRQLLKRSRASFWRRQIESDEEAAQDLQSHFRAVYRRALP